MNQEWLLGFQVEQLSVQCYHLMEAERRMNFFEKNEKFWFGQVDFEVPINHSEGLLNR